MGRLQGKVAFITGAARGQGRVEAVRLAQEGADIIAVDICAQIPTIAYPMSTPEDLAETVEVVQATGRRIVARAADVRDETSLTAALNAGIAELGPVDVVVANAGIAPASIEEQHGIWQDIIDVNLTGVLNTVEVAIPAMIGRGAGGAIVLVSSTAGLMGISGPSRGGLAYAASKHGVVGLMRTYATSLGPHGIRVNSVHPGGVDTPMIRNEPMQRMLAASPTMSRENPNALPVPILDPIDIANAIVWLTSDEGRYVTGVALPVDAGYVVKK